LTADGGAADGVSGRIARRQQRWSKTEQEIFAMDVGVGRRRCAPTVEEKMHDGG